MVDGSLKSGHGGRHTRPRGFYDYHCGGNQRHRFHLVVDGDITKDGYGLEMRLVAVGGIWLHSEDDGRSSLQRYCLVVTLLQLQHAYQSTLDEPDDVVQLLSDPKRVPEVGEATAMRYDLNN